MPDRSVVVRLRADVQAFKAGITDAAKTVGKFKGELTDLGKTSGEKLNDIAAPMAGLGVALAGGFAMVTKAAMDFDKQMSEVAAVSNATGKQLDSLRQAALQAGADTQYSATQAAKATAELAKAGVSVKDILGGGLKGALSLAAAGQMDLADAATISAQAMNMFGLKGKDVVHIADVLASAANTSAADMHGLGLGLQQVGLVAHQAGFSLETTTGLLAAFADRGLAGSDGATSLKTAIQKLQSPSKEAQKIMSELGLTIYDSNGKMYSAASIAAQLQNTMKGLSQEQRDAAMNTIFGSDAIRAANILYDLGGQGVLHYTAAVDKQGAAAATAAKKTDNLAGDIERLKGSLETLAIEAGSGANGGLRMLTQGVDGLVNGFASLPGPVQTTITVMAGLSGAGLLAGAGFLKARQTADDLLTALRDMGPTGTRAADGLGKVGRIAAQATVWGVALYGAYEGARLYLGYLASDTKPVTRDIEGMTRALQKLADTSQASGTLAAAFGADLRGLDKDVKAIVKANTELDQSVKTFKEKGDGFKWLGQGMKEAGEAAADLDKNTRKAAAQAKEDFKSVDTSLANLVKNGGATQAKIAFDQLAASWVAAGHPLEQLTALMPQYTQATGDATMANSGLAQGFGDTEANARTMTGSLQEAIAAGSKLIDVFNQLNGAQIGLTEAQIQAEAAAREFKAALDASGGSLDITTEKGAAAMQAAINLARAGAEVAQAMLQSGASADAASVEFNKYRERLIGTLMAAGMTRQAAEALAESIMKLPPSRQIQIAAPGLENALVGVTNLGRYLSGLPQQKRIEVITTYYANNAANQNYLPRGQNVAKRHGGIVNAAGGLATEAGIYQDGVDAVHFAEKGTGGELFLPLRGITDARAAALLAVGAKAYGLTVGKQNAYGPAMTMMRNTSSWPGSASAAGAAPALLAAPIVKVFIGNEEITSRVRVVVNQEQDRVAAAVTGGVRY